MRTLVATLLASCMVVVGVSATQPVRAAGADDDDKLDLTRFSCARAIALRATDPGRYEALALWVAGWRAEPKVETAFSPPAVKAAGGKWAAACAARPQIPFAEVTAAITADEMAGTPTTTMAAFRCQNFLDLNAESEKDALAMIRWIDGWNASALGQSTVNFYYHKKQMASALDGCMNYDTKPLMYVTAGKYR